MGGGWRRHEGGRRWKRHEGGRRWRRHEGWEEGGGDMRDGRRVEET